MTMENGNDNSHEQPAGPPAGHRATGDQAASVRFRLPGGSDFIDAAEPEKEGRIKDYLRTSLQMQHLVVLCGSGTSIESGYPSMPQLWEAARSLSDFMNAQKVVSYESGDNIEEFLSRCDAFLELNPGHVV